MNRVASVNKMKLGSHLRFFVRPVIEPQILPRLSSEGSISLLIANDHHWILLLAGVVAARKKRDSRFSLFKSFDRLATQCPPRTLPIKKANLVCVTYLFLVIVRQDFFKVRHLALDCVHIHTACLSVYLTARNLIDL